MSRKIGIISLGCAKNQVDAEIMIKKLSDAGYTITANENEAEVIIINTCGFIEEAKQEAIENIFEIAALKENKILKAIVVTGCLTERYREQLRSQMPEVDAAVSIGRNGDIVEIVNDVLGGKKQDYFEQKENLPLDGERILLNEPWFAYLKIAEGCSNRCAYCAIPSIRGDMRSRTMESIINEAESLAKQNVKELIVIAQDTTRYGEDIYGRCMLPELLEKLCKIDGFKWIRLLYTYPDRITDELLRVMAENEKIVKYVDMAVQHCNGDILKSMNRPGNHQKLTEKIEKIRKAVPGIFIRTTIIAGFPSETDEQFNELCEFVRDTRFERLGCFAYSPEEDTPAALMPNQIDDDTKNQRQSIIMQEQAHVSDEINQSLNGKNLDVLCEGYDDYIKCFFGRSQYDAPDIDCKVFFKSQKNIKPGDFVRVTITGSLDFDLMGEEK